jgi:plastocyanin
MTMRILFRPRFVVLLAALAVIAWSVAPAAAGSGAGSSKTQTKRVSVRDDAFSPKTVDVARNGKVVWSWKGSNDHNVKFRRVPSGASKRGSQTQSSGRFARTFSKSGTYRYVCTIHEDLGMKGTIKVK